MARPKLPDERRKRITMTVRIRVDLDDGLAAVAHLRGSTKSGLVSQYAAELIRIEQERDRPSFVEILNEVIAKRLEREKKKAAQLRASAKIKTRSKQTANTTDKQSSQSVHAKKRTKGRTSESFSRGQNGVNEVTSRHQSHPAGSDRPHFDPSVSPHSQGQSDPRDRK